MPAITAHHSQQTLFFLLWPLAVLLVFLFSSPLFAADDIIKLDTAQIMLADTSTLPADGPGWQRVTLTDRWDLARYHTSDNGWYRLSLDLPTLPGDAWGIYLPRFNMNAAIFLNGHLLGDGGQFNEPVARNWNQPLLVHAPATLWRSGANTVHIRLKSYPGHGYLAPVYVGPLAALTPEYDFRRLLQVDISAALFPVTLVIGVFIFALWAKRRHDSQYLWFALAVLAWSHYSVNMIVVNIPIPVFAWEVLAYASVDWFAVFLAIFGLRFAGHSFGRRDQFFLLFAVAATLAYALADQSSIKAVARIWHGGAILIGSYVALVMLGDARRSRKWSIAAMAAGLAIILLSAVHDWMFQFGYISVTGRTGFHLLHYSAPVIFTLMAWHLVRRFIKALNEAEMLNRELEQRIEKKARALEQHYATIQSMEKREAVLKERERLSREIHDGMSGNLANAIMMSDLIGRDLHGPAESKPQQRLQRLKRQLNDGLAEMRNLILTMEGDVSTLGELLNHLNDKCGQLLGSADINFTLEADIGDDSHHLSQKQSLNILRILQEAANNIIKHSGAETVILRISDKNGIHFQISDDGCGFDSDDTESGYGMGNMRKRAEEIGAQLEVSSIPNKSVSLVLDVI